MRFARSLSAVDSHTEGMPTRVITGGVPALPGSSMAERRARFIAEGDGLRKFLMNEPRGHSAMSGAILQPPTRPDADWGVLFIEVSGCLPMCGHGTIGVATVLVETGMVTVTEPVTVIRLDTPAGLVTAHVDVLDGRARAVTIVNVASYLDASDVRLDVPGLGEVLYDMAYGGNFYAILDLAQTGIPFDRGHKDQIMKAGLDIMAAINGSRPPTHRTQPEISGCHHVQLVAPGRDGSDARNAMVIHPGWFDRSPCGTGTSARLAQLHARQGWEVGRPFVNESLIGTNFTGTISGVTDVAGHPAIIPTITGRAWITGMGNYLLDPDDPFPEGFIL